MNEVSRILFFMSDNPKSLYYIIAIERINASSVLNTKLILTDGFRMEKIEKHLQKLEGT